LWDTEIGRVLTITAYDAHLEQLFEIMNRVTAALTRAGIEYRIVGGLAVFLHVATKDPLAARATRDIDIAVDRDALARIRDAVEPFGFDIRHAAGVDMLVDAAQPSARSAVRLYVEAVPGFSAPAVTAEGVLLAPVADLVRMKLTSYRLKDRVHVQDLDAAGLITPEIEQGLPSVLRDRLAEVRASE
jgi:hypothetical protein